MIRSLRRRFILIAVVSLIITLTLLCAFTQITSYHTMSRRFDEGIRVLYENGGELPEIKEEDMPAIDGAFQMTVETPYELRYFTVRFDNARDSVEIDTDHIAAFSKEQAAQMAKSIYDKGKTSGYLDYYRYGVFAEENGVTVIVMDGFQAIQLFHKGLTMSLLISVAFMLAVLLLVMILSKRAIRPFIENMERQRQFVTDASHELKTPLTIIAANNNLIETILPDNKWVKSTEKQISRMNLLIRNLIELAHTEESAGSTEWAEFSLSDVAASQAEAFAPLVEAHGCRLETQVQPGIQYRGAQDNLFRLFSLLLDNAVKYCTPGGTIKLALCRKGRLVVFTLSNPCQNLKPADIPKLFDRFYRADASRARATGGYGIGLSTAKAIVEQHHGKISAKYENGQITFTVSLPAIASKKVTEK